MLLADLGTADVLSLLAAVVSIALAVFAIWQASTFYRWSDQASKEASQSAREIRSSVERIEKLYDTFYSDTFGLMKDTYADFRKHTWPEGAGDDMAETAEQIASSKIAELKAELNSEIEHLMERGSSTEEAVNDMRSELSKVVDRAINASREVEIEAEASVVRPAVEERVEELRERGQKTISAVVFARPFLKKNLSLGVAFKELYAMRDEGLIDFEVNPESSSMIPDARARIRFDF